MHTARRERACSFFQKVGKNFLEFTVRIHRFNDIQQNAAASPADLFASWIYTAMLQYPLHVIFFHSVVFFFGSFFSHTKICSICVGPVNTFPLNVLRVGNWWQHIYNRWNNHSHWRCFNSVVSIDELSLLNVGIITSGRIVGIKSNPRYHLNQTLCI